MTQSRGAHRPWTRPAGSPNGRLSRAALLGIQPERKDNMQTRNARRQPSAIVRAAMILAAVASLSPSDAEAARRRSSGSADMPPAIQEPEREHVNSAPSPSDIVWGCHWNGDSAVVCELLSSPEKIEPMKVDPRLPEVVSRIRNAPESVKRSVAIPMHSVPYDMAFTGELAVSVMCGARNECSVIFGKNREKMSSEISRLIPPQTLALAR